MDHKPMNRRTFLKGAILTSGAAVLAARAPSKAFAAAEVFSLPRKQTLYFNGQQWGSVNGWNPYSGGMNNSMAISAGDNARVTVFETPYIYNMLDGKQYPLLADGDFHWNALQTEITFKLKAAARWSDGTPVTAADVAYTFASHVKYQTPVGQGLTDFIASITAVDAQTVKVTAKLNQQSKAVNPLMVSGYLSSNYVIQKAWTQKLEQRSADGAAFIADLGLDFVSSGPYMHFSNNDQMVVLVRNDAYWGKDASMWGKLPAPKYLAHVIYPTNADGTDALKAGEVDVSQQYIENVQNLWLTDKLPISTYMDAAPYSICASLPTAYFNLNSNGLDQVAIRKAIAMAVDYDTIVANAMTNQSPTFTQAPRSVMNPTPGEQALYDHDAVKDLQWAGGDIVGANKLLDDAGIIDTDADGVREFNGKKLSYTAVCPNGWTDWMAAIAIIAATGAQIGIEITALYPEWGDYAGVFTDGTQTDYGIFMMGSSGSGPTNPWARVRQLMSSEYAGTTGNWGGNWGGYQNAAVDEVIAKIPMETDPATLKGYYTTATTRYLTDVPSFTVMYRPQAFHTVNESVWTGFPKAADGKNIPPLDLTDGYSIAGLYNLKLSHPLKVFLPKLTR